jgi:6-O-methylguanine DNA methyltransferase, DNA binding domain
MIRRVWEKGLDETGERALSMSAKKKTWQEKLADTKGFPKVCPIDETKSKRWGSGTFVIPAPTEVDALMRRVPKGKLTTIEEIRKALAQRHGATIACPITTGIFAWIAAHAAVEAQADGAKNTTPYWRTLKTGGELNPKYPGGIAGLKKKLAAENHQVFQKGKRFFVVDYQQKLEALPA